MIQDTRIQTKSQLAGEYAERGLYVFPCHWTIEQRCSCGNPDCEKPGKHPLVKWRDQSTTNPLQVLAWWQKWPEANIGCDCGKSKLYVIDVEHDGFDELADLELAYHFLPATWISLTGGGGEHYYFGMPDPPLNNTTKKIAGHIDSRGEGGYVLLPGSYTEMSYRWRYESSPDEATLAALPEWLELMLATKSPAKVQESPSTSPYNGSTGSKWLDEALKRALPGNRNDTGYWLADQLRNDGIPIDVALATPYPEMVPAGEKPYTRAEWELTVKSRYDKPAKEPARSNGHHNMTNQSIDLDQEPEFPAEPDYPEGMPASSTMASMPEAATVPLQNVYNDTANAIRLAKRYGGKLRHVAEWGWLVWDGKRWEHDKNSAAMACAKDTARAIYREAADADDEHQAKALAGWATKSLNRPKLEAMLVVAKDQLSARPEHFDADPLLLNCENGILDLRTGQLRAHDSRVLATKIAGTYYDPEADCPTWDRFLDRVLNGNAELIDYLQRAVGYSLSGDTSEQCLLFLHGRGANGKSTFIRTLLEVLGDYAQQAAPNLLMMGERHPTEIAGLAGARFVATVEVEEGRRLAEVLTKQLTGGDRVTARYMRRDFFTFDPSFKLWLSANHKPVIRGQDYAIWRRIRLIPFEVVIPEEERDAHLLDKLRDELPGILAWAVRGCTDWLRDGLPTPEKVKQATAAYQSEMDLLAGFFDECCQVDKQFEAGASALYSEFEEYCKQNGEKPWSQRAFSMKLAERGFSKRKTNTGIIWQGLGLMEKSSSA